MTDVGFSSVRRPSLNARFLFQTKRNWRKRPVKDRATKEALMNPER
jgi:hypothetical protein